MSTSQNPITFRCDASLRKELDHFASAVGLPRSVILTRALSAYLREHGGKATAEYAAHQRELEEQLAAERIAAYNEYRQSLPHHQSVVG